MQFHQLFFVLKSAYHLSNELNRDGIPTKSWINSNEKKVGGKPYTKNRVYKLITNPVYIGKVTHYQRKAVYDGIHEPIIDHALWNQAQELLQRQQRSRGVPKQSRGTMLVKLLRAQDETPYVPTYTGKPNGKKYNYYRHEGTNHRVVSNVIERLVWRCGKNSAKHVDQPLINKPIFLLSDSALIKPKKDENDPKRLSFNEPFCLWYSLVAFKAWGKKLVLGPLPAPESYYDCGEISAVLKKTLRHAIEHDQWPRMTSAQIQKFVQFITNQEGQFEQWQIDRIASSLEKGVAINDDIREVINGLMQLEVIQKELEHEKKKITDDFHRKQSYARTEIDKLTKERQKLQDLVDVAKQDARQITTSLSQAIMKSFQNAKEKGIATLADAALFQALIGTTSYSPNNITSPHIKVPRLQIQGEQKLECSFESILKACGLERGQVRFWQELAKLAAKHHFIVTFKGFAASYVARAFASSLSKICTITIDTPLDLVDVGELECALEAQSEWDVLIITNINRIPLNVLASKLEELTLRKWLGQDASEKLIVVTLDSAESSFPITDQYRLLGPIFDLDNPSLPANCLPDLYEALNEPHVLRSIPKIWVEKITALANEAVEKNAEEAKTLLGFFQALFIPPKITEIIRKS